MKKVIPAFIVLLVVGACLPTVPTPIAPTATAVIVSSSNANTGRPGRAIAYAHTWYSEIWNSSA